ncbi:MAG TPA: sensor histidine kinase [Gaiellaceae bacterium]|nr:sensor histidine kinase [Gaiellaceae bacterium]
MRPVTVDRILAVVLLAVAETEVWATHDAGGHRVSAAVVAPVLQACLALRRRYPLAAGMVAATTEAIQFGISSNTQVIATSIAWFCALYGLTVWTSPRRFALGATFVTVVNLAGAYRKPDSVIPFGIVTLVVMLLVRRVLGDREQRIRLAERERDVAAREAVVEERARIARELHDAIAHNVSMMVVQAGAERRALSEDSSTREVLETVEQIGRSALTEMRRLVGMLRSDGDDPLAPQPGLRDLPLLVSQVRDAGLPVELSVEGEPRELPVGLELSAYRIVQEALTNALKHAGEARATVRIRYAQDSLELEIADDGLGAPRPATPGGHGLVGMRERVALYGGRFEAARGAAGGFAVRVALPIR